MKGHKSTDDRDLRRTHIAEEFFTHLGGVVLLEVSDQLFEFLW
jgi:hypothetical protein